jgi:hypothetical protein
MIINAIKAALMLVVTNIYQKAKINAILIVKILKINSLTKE